MKFSFKKLFHIKSAHRKTSKTSKPKDVESGRISKETALDLLNRFQDEWTFLDPEIPAHILEAIERFALVIPDFSQHCRNVINLGNTGHTLEVTADRESVIRATEDRLNVLARSVYPYGGADGLVNKMLWDLVVFGTPSIEAAISPGLDRVQKVVCVPVPEIVFKYSRENDEYAAYQKAGNSQQDYLELNPLTYFYSPLFQRRNSPYAIPPLLSALSPLLNQLFMLENVRHIVKKIGLMGLIHAVLATPARKPAETEDQYLGRLKTYLSNVATDLTKNYRDGVMITYDEFTLNHFDATGDVRGVKDLFQLNEEQVASGMDTDPAMLGRTYSTTETYAGVVYAKMLKEIENFQRIVRRGIEKIYLLDLYLAGIPVNDVNIGFNPGAELKPVENAEIESSQSESVRNLYVDGIITLDEARDDLGYPPLETSGSGPEGPGETPGSSMKRAKFDFRGGRYVFQFPSVVLRSALALAPNANSKKKVRLRQNESEEQVEDRRLEYAQTYLRDVLKLDASVREQIIAELRERAARGELPQDVDNFVREVYATVVARYPVLARQLGLADIVRRNLATIYEFYRLSDDSLWYEEPPVRINLQQTDVRAQEFLAELDDIYFSEYVQNEPFRDKLTQFLRDEVLENGFQATDAVLERFGNEWADNSDINVRRIVDTAVTRVRTFAHVRQLKLAGIEELEIMEIMDRITCGRCREEDGRIVSVALADEVVENFKNLTPEQFRERFITSSSEQEAMQTPIGDQVRRGQGLPPFHTLCRGRIKARFKVSLTAFEKDHGELPEIERHHDADYSEHDKKLPIEYVEKLPNGDKKNMKSKQTIVYSILNPLGKKIYLTKEGIVHTANGHASQRRKREQALGIAGSIVANPDEILLDERRGNDTKVYLRQIRGKTYAVITKRAGPEFIWTAFECRRKSSSWLKVWAK